MDVTEGFERKVTEINLFSIKERARKTGAQYMELCVFCPWGVGNMLLNVSFPVHTGFNQTPKLKMKLELVWMKSRANA